MGLVKQGTIPRYFYDVGFLFLRRSIFEMKKIILTIDMIFALIFLHPGALSASDAGSLRVVSLAPATTEILFALGLDREIVGVTTFCKYPPKALAKEKVGTFSHPSIEKIISLKPDIIFCTGLEQNDVVAKLKQLNLNICISDPSNFEELFASILKIGSLVNRDKEAAGLVSAMRHSIDEIRSKTANVSNDKKPRVFVEIWNDPLTTAGKGSFVDELISLAGGTNIAGDVNKPYFYFNPEEVVRRDPDYIILAYMDNKDSLKMFGKRIGWNSVSAIKNNRVYGDIDPDLLLKPGPRLVDGLREVHKRLYP